jgi:hypothetical protein
MKITTAVFINYSPEAQARKLFVFINIVNQAVTYCYAICQSSPTSYETQSTRIFRDCAVPRCRKRIATRFNQLLATSTSTAVPEFTLEKKIAV